MYGSDGTNPHKRNAKHTRKTHSVQQQHSPFGEHVTLPILSKHCTQRFDIVVGTTHRIAAVYQKSELTQPQRWSGKRGIISTGSMALAKDL